MCPDAGVGVRVRRFVRGQHSRRVPSACLLLAVHGLGKRVVQPLPVRGLPLVREPPLPRRAIHRGGVAAVRRRRRRRSATGARFNEAGGNRRETART